MSETYQKYRAEARAYHALMRALRIMHGATEAGVSGLKLETVNLPGGERIVFQQCEHGTTFNLKRPAVVRKAAVGQG